MVRSSALNTDTPIPVRYKADGSGLPPPLEWSSVPEDAHSVVIIVEDADSPTPRPLVHAIIVNLEADDTHVPEGALNSPDHQGVGLQAGRNSYLMQAWLPPDPPPAHGTHRYVFQVFALRSGAHFSATPGRHEVIDAIANYALAGGYLVGTYERAQRMPLKPPYQENLRESMASGAASIA
jgi:Raf kinase inhibitor-like YbhB/YbcL family protein